MKTISLKIIFTILLSTLFVSCEDSIPRDRPDLVIAEVVATGTPTETEDKAAVFERPSGAILIQPTHCACSKGVPASIGNCASICSTKSSSENKILHFDVELKTAITATYINDMEGFCSTQAEDIGDVPASCNVEFKDQNGNIAYFPPFVPSANQTTFAVDIGGDIGALNVNETYRVTIVENVSKARSSTIQLRLTSPGVDDPVGGPLALMPVNQYSCLFRSGFIDAQTGDLIISDVNRFHFYFIPETRPEPLLPATLPTVNCYDIETYGTTPVNSPLLEESTGSFSVWNRMDPRFFDLDGDPGTNKLKIHQIIEENLLLQGQSSASIELFFELKWPSGFDDGDTTPGEEEEVTSIQVINSTLGYYMTPFQDEQFNAYCPKQEHYYSSSPLFKAMREVVAIDTEGIYAAKQENVCDFLLVKESLLKQIWFYKENGVHIKPTTGTIRGKQVQFYWPADTSSPSIKKSHQRVYTVKASNEITCGTTPAPTSDGQGTDGVRTNIPAHDKRIGCVPVLR